MGDLTTNFSRYEFECKCGCGADRVDRMFIFTLQLVRERAGFAFEVVSGCRCLEHNAKEGGTPKSDHITDDRWICEGADIKVSGGIQRFKIIEAAIECGVRRIGPAKSFVHLGTALRNPQGVLWVY